MKSTGKLIISIFALLVVAASAYAQSPREQFNQMVEQLQKTPDDNALREKIINLAAQIKPAPAIPEEARKSFIIGQSLYKQAKNLRPAFEAAYAFWIAAKLAPWWSDAYWNLAVAQQFAGGYVSAKESLRLYLLTNPSAVDRRAAQDRLYAIDADIMMATSSLPGGIAGFWQRDSSRAHNEEWKKERPDDVRGLDVRRLVFEIQQAGSTYNIKCIRCEEDWKVSVISANLNSINFQMRLVSPHSDSSPINYECKLNGSELICTIPVKEGDVQERYVKRSVCEIVGGPGITGYFVLCK